MPGVYSYLVTREQQVRVSATTPAEAVSKGEKAFEGQPDDHLSMVTANEVVTTSISAYKEL